MYLAKTKPYENALILHKAPHPSWIMDANYMGLFDPTGDLAKTSVESIKF
jgi:hypothetical protein